MMERLMPHPFQTTDVNYSKESNFKAILYIENK